MNETIASETPHTPFGLPAGSVRGVISVLICAFFWVVLLWPHQEAPSRVVLAHFFLLGLVLMAFASNPIVTDGGIAFLPWFLRLVFVGGSAGVVAYAWYASPQLLRERLTPLPEEVSAWWIPFLACTFCGFSAGLFLRFTMGKKNHVFLTLRAWLSIVAMVMLTLEIVAVIALASAENKQAEFIHYWDCFELAIVSAYFGMRA
jgi:hypothetical protein